MKKINKILWFSSLTLIAGIGGWLYAKKKVAEDILDKIKLDIADVDKINFDFKSFSFRVFLSLKNNTIYDFGVLDGYLEVKEVRCYDKARGNLLARSKINAKNIIFPANGEYVLPPMLVSVGVVEAGVFLLENKKNLNKIDKQLGYEIDIRAFGYEYTITQ